MVTTRLAAIAVAGVLSAGSLSAQPGSPNTTPGGVTRVTLVRIIPGHGDMFWQDMRQNALPILEEQKRRGLITHYTVATKTTTENPEDWNVAITNSYKNWGTFDSFGLRNDSLTLRHYGTAAARTASNLARIPHSQTVASFLIRDQTLNPWR